MAVRTFQTLVQYLLRLRLLLLSLRLLLLLRRRLLPRLLLLLLLKIVEVSEWRLLMFLYTSTNQADLVAVKSHQQRPHEVVAESLVLLQLLRPLVRWSSGTSVAISQLWNF